MLEFLTNHFWLYIWNLIKDIVKFPFKEKFETTEKVSMVSCDIQNGYL